MSNEPLESNLTRTDVADPESALPEFGTWTNNDSRITKNDLLCVQQRLAELQYEQSVEKLFDALMPKILDHLRDMQPSHVKGMVEDAVSLDQVSVAALIDYFHEKQWGTLASQMERYRVQKEDVVVVTLPSSLSSDGTKAIHDLIKSVFHRVCPDVGLLIIPDNINIQQFRMGNRIEITEEEKR